MNLARDLHRRLLHLFPIKVVKEYFHAQGNADEAIEIITGNNAGPAIKEFARQHYLQTKQNIYVFELDKQFKKAKNYDDFPEKIEFESVSPDEICFYLFPKTTFSIYLNTPAVEELSFLSPATVRFQGKIMIVHFTKLNKNEKYYFPEDKSPRKKSVENDEPVILGSILHYFSDSYTVDPLDLNKGVKHLWEKDEIDCPRLQYRDTDSINTVNMNEDKTYKEKYPAAYKMISQAPMNKTSFIYLKKDEYLCAGFTVDPSDGFISITSSPKNPNQVSNVISKILTNNK
jgi:hypothetical protein